MKKILIINLAFAFLIVFTMGCLEGRPTEETKLDVVEGIGVIGITRIDELRPGLAGSFLITVRSNLEGVGASNVTISLENVRPFRIVECGDVLEPNEIRTCSGQLDSDENLPVRSRRTSKMFPGEEIDVFWRLQAPSAEEIFNIALRHPIYYIIEYDYKVSFMETVAFMSQEESFRRREAGEGTLEGSSGITAGELKISSITRQPVLYTFQEDVTEYKPYDFILSYSIENVGKGFPISDLSLIMIYEDGVGPIKDVTCEEYGWCVMKEEEEELFKEIFEDDDWEEIKENENNLLVKRINSTEMMDFFNVFIPMEITDEEMETLSRRRTPIKIYSFNMYGAYRYYIEGKDYIDVFPIKGI